MTEIEARVADLINFSSNQKPIDFEDAFKSIIYDKVAAAIENKKAEIAQQTLSRWDASDNESEDLDDEETDDTETED